MGLRIERHKPRHLLASILYRSLKIPVSDQRKLRMFLDLEWIFNRLANETIAKASLPLGDIRKSDSIELILSGISEDDNVLDLGCGQGIIAAAVAEKAKKVVGIDHDKLEITKAIALYDKPNLHFSHGDAVEYLESGDSHFDVLILSHLLEHLDNPEEFLDRFKDYFSRIFIEVPDFDSTALNHYRKELNLKLRHTDNDHVNEFDRVELEHILRKCGLRILSSEYKFGVQRYWCETK